MKMRAPEIASVRVSMVKMSSMRAGARKSISMRRTTQTILSPCLPSASSVWWMPDSRRIVGAAALEEFEVARVIDDAGEIRVGEVDARHDAMAGWRQRAGEPGGEPFRFTIFGHRAFLVELRPDRYRRPFQRRWHQWRRMIKNCLVALVLVLAAGLPAEAATFSMKRGLNLDIWTTWPQEDRWDDPDVVLPFPEWRQTLDAGGLAALKAAGFDFVRMPVDPAPFLSDKTAELRDRLVESVVESARLVNAAGLKVVVDLHLIPAGGSRSVGMSRGDGRCGDVRPLCRAGPDDGRTRWPGEDPALVAFEPMNEPVVDCEDGRHQLLARPAAAALSPRRAPRRRG